MEQHTQAALSERLLTLIDTGVTDVGDEEARWPTDAYRDPELFDRERETIARYPSLVAHSSQLPNPGDFVLDATTGRELLITRGQDGVVRALVNACRHRGAQLVTRPRGTGTKSFVCPYHAWTYDLEGSLTHVPDQAQSFPNLDRCERPLLTVPVEERHGFVWVLPEEGRRAAGYDSVGDFLGPEVDPELASYGFDRFTFYRQETWDTGVHWKAAVESFLENYHFAYLHRDSTNPVFVHNVGIFDSLGSTHFRGLAPKRSFPELRHVEPGARDLRPHTTIIYVLFPLSILFIEQHHFSLLQIFPTGVDTSYVRATHAVEFDKLSMRSFWNANIALFMAAIKEDLAVCESMQRTVGWGANEDVVFGRNEVGCALYRRRLDDAVAEATAASV